MSLRLYSSTSIGDSYDGVTMRTSAEPHAEPSAWCQGRGRTNIAGGTANGGRSHQRPDRCRKRIPEGD
jgi:hypothetical protein